MRGVGEGTVNVKLRYVHSDRDRHGNVRYYFRRAKGQPKHRLPGEPGSQKFLDAYRVLSERLAGDTESSLKTEAADPPGARPGTFHWLYAQYLRSAAFKALAPTTQAVRRNLIEGMLRETVRPDSPDTYGRMPVSAVVPKALKVLLDRKAGFPEAVNARIRALRHFMKWARYAEHLKTNPAIELEKIRHKAAGHHTWTIDEVERFEARHPIGTKARLALALLLWTGARRSDVYLLGRQHSRNGWHTFRARKNKVMVEAPVLSCLQEVIDASPTGDLTYITTNRGQPFTSEASFGNWFAARCREASVPGRAHGLRKAGATTAAENGATAHQLMAIFGWLTLSEAERYTREAQRRKLAGDGMELLVRRK